MLIFLVCLFGPLFAMYRRINYESLKKKKQLTVKCSVPCLQKLRQPKATLLCCIHFAFTSAHITC